MLMTIYLGESSKNLAEGHQMNGGLEKVVGRSAVMYAEKGKQLQTVLAKRDAQPSDQPNTTSRLVVKGKLAVVVHG